MASKDSGSTADQRIIQSALDMFLACKDAVEYRDLIKQNYPDLPGLVRAMDAMCSAIARAEGREVDHA